MQEHNEFGRDVLLAEPAHRKHHKPHAVEESPRITCHEIPDGAG